MRRVEAEPKLKVTKLPKELELPQMKDHQMFDRPRILQLQQELQNKFKSLKVSPRRRLSASF